ncbi:MAG: hypothetical protein IJR89_04785 [Clostridia bacterium]|nr:hypothetical protein [Clostridia bacterium]
MKLPQLFSKNRRFSFRLPAILALAVVTLLVVFLSGRLIRQTVEKPDPVVTRRAPTTGEPETERSDFGGLTVTVLYSDAERTSGFYASAAPTLMARGDSEEMEMLETEYGLTLRFSKTTNASALLSQSEASGDVPADILALPISGDLSELLARGMLEDLSSHASIDLSHPAYDSEENAPAPVGGKRYLLTGAFLVGYRDAASAVIYDKTALSAFYRPEQLPTALVADGKWTYDAMNRILSEMNSGINAEEPFYQMRIGKEDAPFFWISSGADPVGENGDGTFSVQADGEDPFRRLTVLRDKIYESPYRISGSDGPDNAVFYFGTLGRYGEADRERCALLPMPKAEEDGGTSYRSAVLADRATAAAVPKGAADPGSAAAALNFLFCRSYERYRGEYAADLCGEDKTDAEMLSLILSGTVLGPLDEFGYGEILYSVVSDAVTKTDGAYPTETSLLKNLRKRGTALEFAINVLSEKAAENNANS